MRQAQPSRTSSDSEETRRKASVASVVPAAGVALTSPVWKPRLWAGLVSATSVKAPASSAPAPKPWMQRKSTSSTGAQTPICTAVGSRPMPTVAAPMSTIVRIMAGLRP